jgi:transcriptional regulator of acetoin/glycerol metabolism
MAEGPQIELRDLPARLTGEIAAAVPEPSSPSLEAAEARAILEALERNGGNASAAIRELRIGRAKFYRRLRKLGLEDRVERLREGRA